MKDWHERTIASWEDLNEAIASDSNIESSPAIPGYLFRGHADINWALIPSLTRVFAAAALDPERALDIEETLRVKFIAQVHEHLHPNVLLKIKKSKLLDWWMIMQQYSAPTRLLDWTQSPYVAAYFALIEKPNEDGIVYYFHVTTLDSRMRDWHQGDYGSPLQTKKEIVRFEERLQTENAPEQIYVLQRPIQTDRMAIQQSLYTLCPFILGHHGEIISKTLLDGQNKVSPQLAGRWIIPQDKKMGILAKLRVANITASSLFPGLDGVGRAMSEIAKVEAAYHAHRGETRSDVPPDTEGADE